MKTVSESRNDRLMKRFEQGGFSHMTDREAVEMLLYLAQPRKSACGTVDLLFSRFGSFTGIISATARELVNDCDLSENAAVLFAALPRIIERYGRPVSSVETVSAARRLFSNSLKAENHERLMACFLNEKLRCVGCEIVSEGDPDKTSVNPLGIIDGANRSGSRLIIVAHNHPNQMTASPSNIDITVTRTLKRTLKSVGLILLDHIIVSSTGDTYSMKQSGHFPLIDK